MYLLNLGIKTVQISGTVSDEEWAKRVAESEARYQSLVGEKKSPKPRKAKA